jgi:hypothetical protein
VPGLKNNTENNYFYMGMLSPKNDKDPKGKKQTQNAQGSKFIAKPGKPTGMAKKKITTGAKRGS